MSSNDEFAANADPESQVDYKAEDKAAEQSEISGKIPKSEVEALGGDSNIIEGGRTRGVKNDAMKPERDIDEAIANMDEEDQATTS